MKKIVITLVLSFFVIFAYKNTNVKSYFTLGNVDDYEVEINTRTDGSINMQYNINLSITGESVDNIKIKLPLGNATLISFDNNNISDISFDYRKANIKLNKTFYEGQNLNLNFSINMKDVYRYNEDKGLVIYRITVGDVKYFTNNNIVVKWKKDGVYFQGRGKEIGNYYVWEQKYSFFRSFQVMIQYSQNKFDLLEKDSLKIENFIYNYGLIIIAFSVIILEIKNNILNFSAAKYPFRGKNVI